MQICVIAKEPRPGFAKTRLSPPCTPEQAAAIAEASLADTLDAVARAPARRRVLALDGGVGAWLPAGFDVVAQAGGGLGARLSAAFAWCFATLPEEPVVVIGMDTPQVSASLLFEAEQALELGSDAVLGLATDGGYWLIGLKSFVPGAFAGVPMSSPETGRRQRERLQRLGIAVGLVAELTDVDSFTDARRVAGLVPRGRFAATVTESMRGLAEGGREEHPPHGPHGVLDGVVAG